jgi:hypothetical protein
MQDRQPVALVEQLAHMKADEFIVARVSSETKARLRVLAERQQLSESALLRRLVEFVLLKAGLSPILTESPTGARSLRGARLMIRLRADDQFLLRERAAARGMPPATYVSVLTRSHLRSLAPLPPTGFDKNRGAIFGRRGLQPQSPLQSTQHTCEASPRRCDHVALRPKVISSRALMPDHSRIATRFIE